MVCKEYDTQNRRHHRYNMANHKIRIMLVGEDQKESRIMAAALEKHGYEPILVNKSRNALKIAESAIPHVFVLDLAMTPPDGFQLCKMLRAHRSFRYKPILVITTLDPTDSKIVAIGAGASDFLVRPFQMKDLLSKLGGLLAEESSP
jgi:DNA-binding response OmpR family regulator